MDRNLSALLDRAVGGDPEAVADISRFDQAALLEAQVDAGQPLTLTREATVLDFLQLLGESSPRGRST